MSNIDYLIYHGYAPVTLCRVYRQMPTVEYCFIFVAILGTKVEIHFFYNELMVTMVIDGYLRYVAANFQQLHNEFGRVGYGNLMIVQGA